MPTIRVALGELVMDFAVYPRSRTSATHVSHMVEALAAGRKLPPPVIDKASKRVVDGWHRVRAYQRVLEATDKITVDARSYADEAELLREAIRLNADHGRPLSPYDQARSISLAEAMGLSVDDIAADLGLTAVKVKSIRDTTLAYDQHGQPVVLKRGVASFNRGKTLTAEQVEANEHLDGMTALYHVNWLVRAMEAGLVEWHEQLSMRAARLAELLEEHL